MPPTGLTIWGHKSSIRCGEAAFIKVLRTARPRPSAGWYVINYSSYYN